MIIPFLDLQQQYSEIKEEVQAAFENVMSSSQFILGPDVQQFENAFAAAHRAKFGVAVSNGTAALHLALWAQGIGPGDEVIVPTNTFIATAEAVVLCGATPVFVDCDEYYNIDPEKISDKISANTRAVIPVHLYGQPARMTEINQIALENGIAIIEDAAQAHLAQFDSQFVGSWGSACCFSFYPGKNLGAYGEAGAVITNDESLYEKMRLLRDHGSQTKYVHLVSGHNYRLESLQAAFLNVKLPRLFDWTEKRRAAAKKYCELLVSTPQVILPKVHPLANPVWHLFVVQVENRDELIPYLSSRGISTGLHYPTPLHLQPAFLNVPADREELPCSEEAAKKILSLPMFPELRSEQIEYVVQAIQQFYG